MELEHAIRSRRTHKAFGPDPVTPEVLEELFELARWAPNHNLTNPWRFRVLGTATLARLKALAEELAPGSGGKLDRAPTLVVASVLHTGDDAQRADDLLATAVAAYLVLLAAHGRGLASYWRSVPLLDSPAGREALGARSGRAADRTAPSGLAAPGAARARAGAGRGLRQLPALSTEGSAASGRGTTPRAAGPRRGSGLDRASNSTRAGSGAATTRLRPARLASYSASSAALKSVS